MYQISANSDEKRAQDPQNTENWGYCYMGAMPKRGSIYPIFEPDLPADKRRLYEKFLRSISIRLDARVITTDGRTDRRTCLDRHRILR